jgi:AraC-like DNA-binding protein
LTGFGFLDYLTQIRLQEAQRLLRTTALSLSDISEMCGFSGSNYFGDVFRRYTGLSPSAYRKIGMQ